MNSRIDGLLDMVDEWKFKLHDKLKRMTPKQRTKFWEGSHERARAMGLQVAEVKPEPAAPARPKRKRRRRAKAKA